MLKESEKGIYSSGEDGKVFFKDSVQGEKFSSEKNVKRDFWDNSNPF